MSCYPYNYFTQARVAHHRLSLQSKKETEITTKTSQLSNKLEQDGHLAHASQHTVDSGGLCVPGVPLPVQRARGPARLPAGREAKPSPPRPLAFTQGVPGAFGQSGGPPGRHRPRQRGVLIESIILSAKASAPRRARARPSSTPARTTSSATRRWTSRTPRWRRRARAASGTPASRARAPCRA